MGLGHYMVKEAIREIGNKSREFYEFVLPPVDMVMENDTLIVKVDMPGFDKKQIKVRIRGNILSINAKRETIEEGSTAIWRQRPNVVDKKLRLPVEAKEGEDLGASAKYLDGVLTLRIPAKTGKNITIE